MIHIAAVVLDSSGYDLKLVHKKSMMLLSLFSCSSDHLSVLKVVRSLMSLPNLVI